MVSDAVGRRRVLYPKGLCPAGVRLVDTHEGVVPFIVLQLIGLGLVFAFAQRVSRLAAMACAKQPDRPARQTG